MPIPLIALMIAGCVVAQVMTGRKLRETLSPYWSRKCTGFLWKRAFPQASKNDIRSFLSLFVEVFGIRKSRRLCFVPNDKVLDVYKALHPPGWCIPDNFELEDLVLEIEKRYGVDVTHRWNETITLGELFNLSLKTTQNKGLD